MSKGKLLLIDDDVPFLEVIQEILSMEGYNITCLTEPGNIKSLVASLLPDIILLDYRLKTTCGGQVCKKLRADLPTSTLPIVLLSAYPEAQLPLNEIPFTVFIPKPFDLWDFLSCIEELMADRSIS